MRYIVYGAGAVGSLLGGYLGMAGANVALVGRPAHVAQIRAAGLRLKNKDGTHTVRLDAVENIREISPEPDDVVFLTVKSQDTAAATADLKAHLPADVPIFCFQNGTRNEEVVARIFSQVYGGLVLMAMRYVAPGQVTHLLGKTLALGQYPEGLDGRAKAVGAALGTAGFKVVPHRRVMALKWTKLIANSANAVYALIGMPVIEACNLPKVQTYVADLWDEGMDVLDAAHITYEPFPNRPGLRELAERLRHAGPAQPPPDDADFSFYPSTWQDLDLRRGTTELKYLNGELVALGERFGVPAPLNSLLETLVEDMAARGERPGKYSLEQLQALSARVRRV